ncbi:MAG: hypothetical protein R3A44_43495 [Caldilineaceae bacterium]
MRITVMLVQENLELAQGSQIITQTKQVTVTKSELSGQEATTFDPMDTIARLPYVNQIYPGCDIKLANALSPWQFKLWIDLNRDGKATGAEPTCIVEAPTADTTPRFSGWSTAADVVLSWSTGVEIDLLGFNLYRASDPAGPYTRINPELIMSVGDALGADYRYVDNPPAAGLYFYQIESVASSGQTVSGPIAILYPAPAYRIYLPLAQQ